MSVISDGVSRYIKGHATVEVFFPVDHRGTPSVCCEQCRFFNRRSVRCNLNEQVCNYPGKYIGSNCPLVFEESY